MNDVLSSWLGLSPEMSIRWGLTLLHFLWQGIFIGLVTFSAARLLRNQSAVVRYWLHAAALLACPVTVAVTFAVVQIPSALEESSALEWSAVPQPAIPVAGLTLEFPDTQFPDTQYPDLNPHAAIDPSDVEVADPQAKSTVASDESLNAPTGVSSSERIPSWLSATAKAMTLAYAVGVVGFLIRLASALWGGHRLRAISRPVSDSTLLKLIRDQAQCVGLRLVPVVAWCERIAVPTVIGVLRPMILLPATLTTGLSPDEFSAILSHEMAHIRRYDLWMNLLQRVIESLLFFHPVVWFLSRRLSAEREICCDDLVVRCGHEPMHYAGALLRMAELCAGVSPQNSLALAATTGGPTLLEHRVLRLIQASPVTRLHLNRRGLFLLASTLSLVLAIFVPVIWWLSDSSTNGPLNSNSALGTSDSQQSPDEIPKKEGETPEKQAAVEEPASTTVMIAGRVELEDGTLVTKPGSLHIRSQSNRSSTNLGCNLEAGRFSAKVLAGKMNVAAFVDGYAPAWTDEFELSGGSTKDDLVIVLKTGTKKTIRFVDEDDNPVAGATLVMHPEIHGETVGPVIELKTDIDGLLTVEHLADTLYGIRVYAPKFQTLRTDRVSISGEEELVQALKRCRPATGLILNSDGTPSAGAAVLKCIEALSTRPNSGASYYSTNSEDGGWFGQRIATTNTDGRFELDQLNDDSQYMLVIQGTNGSRLVLSDLVAGQVDREITLPERRDLMITVTGDTSPLTLRYGKPFVVIRQEITMRTATGHGSSGSLGADMPLELDAMGGSATFRGLIVDPQADQSSAEVEVSLGYGNDFKKTVHIEPEGDTKVTFQLPPAKLDAAEPKSEKDEKSRVSTDVSIRYPHCVLEIENLQPRPLSDAIAAFNLTSQESPTGVLEQPITEQETRDAIATFASEEHVPEAVQTQLNDILKSGTLPENVYFRRFTRFDDGKQMQGVWWVRLVVETKDGPVYSVPVRSKSLFARPYTQMERQQNAADGLTLLGRVASYYETPPEPFKAGPTGSPTDSPDAPLGRAALEIRHFRPDWTFQKSVDALIGRTNEALKGNDTAGFKALFETTGASATLQEFAVSELQEVAQSQVHAMKVSPVTLQGNTLTWSAWQFYKPNLPVVAFLEIEYEDKEVSTRRADAQPLADKLKTLSLELGFVRDELWLVNYVPDGEANPPRSLNPGTSISGHLEPLADGTHLVTDVITDPGSLLSARLANEEVRLRDFTAAGEADDADDEPNAKASSNDEPEDKKASTVEKSAIQPVVEKLAASPALRDWTVHHIDDQPGVEVDGFKGYRVVFQRSWKEFTNPPQSAAIGVDQGPFEMRSEDWEFVLIPPEPKKAPAELRSKIAWRDSNSPYHTRDVCMGEGLGCVWFTRGTLFGQELVRQSMKLAGGDDRIQLMMDGMRVQDAGTNTANSCQSLTGGFGDAALPYIRKTVDETRNTEEMWRVVGSLGVIPAEQATELLLTYYDSTNEDIQHAAEYGLIRKPYRPAAKRAYLDMLQRKSYVDRVCEACLEFQWTEAVPILREVVSHPGNLQELQTTIPARRALEGNPIPEELLAAARLIEANNVCRPQDMSPEVGAAYQLLKDTSDAEAANLLALRLANFTAKMTGNNIRFAGFFLLIERERESTLKFLISVEQSLSEKERTRIRKLRNSLSMFSAGAELGKDGVQGTSTSLQEKPQKSGAVVDDAQRTLVATILGKKLFLDELEGGDFPRSKKGLSQAELNELGQSIRGKRLLDRVSATVVADYAEREKIAVSPEMAREHRESVLRSDLPPRPDDDYCEEAGRLVSYAWGNASLKDWLICKSLYERYGGRVGMGTLGLWIAVDGRNALMKEYLRDGRVQIHDSELEKAFWKSANEPNFADAYPQGEDLKRAMSIPPYKRR